MAENEHSALLINDYSGSSDAPPPPHPQSQSDDHVQTAPQQQQQQPMLVNQYQFAPHLAYLQRQRQLPPYDPLPTLRDQWRALSNTSKAFLIIVPLLWLLLFVFDTTRLPALFLPVLFVPTLALYYQYRKHSDKVELNLLLNTYIMGFTVGALVVLLLELVLTVLVGVATLFDQFDAIKDWWYTMVEASQSGTSVGEQDMFYGLRRTAGFFVFLFLLSFLVAAGVEESMKLYLGLRIKRVTVGYRDKQGWILYVLAGALGFSTVENIGYATSVTSPMLDVFINIVERTFISTPLHLCCAYLLAIGIVRREVFGEPLRLWRIMVFPVFYHGLFDFLLMIVASVTSDDGVLLASYSAIIVGVFVLLGVTIYFEGRQIAGEPPVLPTSTSPLSYAGVPAENSEMSQYPSAMPLSAAPISLAYYQSPPPPTLIGQPIR